MLNITVDAVIEQDHRFKKFEGILLSDLVKKIREFDTEFELLDKDKNYIGIISTDFSIIIDCTINKKNANNFDEIINILLKTKQ